MVYNKTKPTIVTSSNVIVRDHFADPLNDYGGFETFGQADMKQDFCKRYYPELTKDLAALDANIFVLTDTVVNFIHLRKIPELQGHIIDIPGVPVNNTDLIVNYIRDMGQSGPLVVAVLNLTEIKLKGILKSARQDLAAAGIQLNGKDGLCRDDMQFMRGFFAKDSVKTQHA